MEKGSARLGVITSFDPTQPSRPCRRDRPRTNCSPAQLKRLEEKGFLVSNLETFGRLGPHRLDLADDLRPGLLRRRDDPRFHGALRPRPVRQLPARQPAPVRRDDRRRHAVQQDGARPCARSTTRWPSRAGSSPWVLAPMAAAIIIIRTRWYAVATASSRSISMCRAAPRPRRRCCMEFLQLQKKIRRDDTPIFR